MFSRRQDAKLAELEKRISQLEAGQLMYREEVAPNASNISFIPPYQIQVRNQVSRITAALFRLHEHLGLCAKHQPEKTILEKKQ